MLIDILHDLPEGYTDGEKFIVGRPHNHILPGYQP